MYDIIIIGGGIAGLNCAKELSLKNKILLIEKNNYLGGRIYTHSSPHYETGAEKIVDSHKNMLTLINNYKLNLISINTDYDFLSSKSFKITKNINAKITKILKFICDESEYLPKTKLQELSFHELLELFFEPALITDLFKFIGYISCSDFNIMNAYDSIRLIKNNYISKKYFKIKEGLSSLCNKIKKTIKNNNGQIELNETVYSINKLKKTYQVNTNYHVYDTKKIIFTINPHHLEKFNILNKIKPLYKSVKKTSLLKIYGLYPKINGEIWFKYLRNITTDSFLKNIIPINYQQGTIMISYTHDRDINKFTIHGELLPNLEIKRMIQSELKRLFPKKNIPDPVFIKTHYWKEGVYFWKKGYHSDLISKMIINPIKNIYICGEAFSQNQTWMEGALETSIKVINKIN